MAAKWARVRNQAAVIGMALVGAAVAEWWGWVTWLYAMSSQHVFIADPMKILNDAIPFLAEKGVWSISGSTPTGAVLEAFWSAELLMIFGTAVYMAHTGTKSEAFCEACGKWVDDRTQFQPLGPVNDDPTLRAELESGNHRKLEALRPHEASPFYRVELARCGCQKLHLMTMRQVTVNFNDKGEATTNEVPVVDNLLLTQAGYASLAAKLQSAGDTHEEADSPEP